MVRGPCRGVGIVSVASGKRWGAAQHPGRCRTAPLTTPTPTPPPPSLPPCYALQVQVLVEVRSGRWQERRQFELLECTPDTGITELKQQAAAAAEAEGGAAAAPVGQQELTFMGQTCQDGKALRDYGVAHDWLAQVAGFVLKPAGK